MTTRPGPSSRDHGRRLAAALGIGMVATVAGSGAGALTLGLLGVLYEGPALLRAVPAVLLYGLILGPVFAWPVTLVVLPAVRLFAPPRFLRSALPAGGILAGAGTLLARVAEDPGLGRMGWTMVAAGAVGGLVAGLVFVAFLPRPAPDAPPAREIPL